MKTIAFRTMMAFGMALLGGIVLIAILAAGLNVLVWLSLIRPNPPSGGRVGCPPTRLVCGFG